MRRAFSIPPRYQRYYASLRHVHGDLGLEARECALALAHAQGTRRGAITLERAHLGQQCFGIVPSGRSMIADNHVNLGAHKISKSISEDDLSGAASLPTPRRALKWPPRSGPTIPPVAQTGEISAPGVLGGGSTSYSPHSPSLQPAGLLNMTHHRLYAPMGRSVVSIFIETFSTVRTRSELLRVWGFITNTPP